MQEMSCVLYPIACTYIIYHNFLNQLPGKAMTSYIWVVLKYPGTYYCLSVKYNLELCIRTIWSVTSEKLPMTN